MSIKKVTLASLILLSLTACSSGGSGGNSNNATKPNAKPQTTQQQTDKAAAEKSAKEKAAREKAEAERLAAEKSVKEKAEAERLAAEKAAKEKVEADRLAAEKASKEKAERLEKEFAELDVLKGINSAEFPTGIVHRNLNKDYSYDDGNGYREGKSQHLYNQKYSAVMANTYWSENTGWKDGKYINEFIYDASVEIKGKKTENIPTEGIATYSGIAFHYQDEYAKNYKKLTYIVDFYNRIGSGKVQDPNGFLYTLNQGKLDKDGLISGSVVRTDERELVAKVDTRNGSYEIEFFGPNAEEVGGEMLLETDDLNSKMDNTFGLSGTRGEIKK